MSENKIMFLKQIIDRTAFPRIKYQEDWSGKLQRQYTNSIFNINKLDIGNFKSDYPIEN